jgi:hypothetical protein
MLTLEPLGMPEVLPAFVVGFEPSPAGRGLPKELDAPPWMLQLDQQAGGLCMTYPRVFGAVLRLEANLDKGRNRPQDLVRGLHAMAEDPDMEVLAEYPVLRSLVKTQGDPYDRPELRRLSAFVSQYFDVGPFESGIEAFVRCADLDPRVFFGWRAFSCAFKPGFQPTSTVIDDGMLHAEASNLVLSDDEIFGDSMLQQLEDAARSLALFLTPRVFLLWENSD